MTVYTQPHFENRVVNHVPVRCLRAAGSTLVEFHDYAHAVGAPCESALSALVRSGAPFVAIDGLMFTPAEMVRRIPGNDTMRSRDAPDRSASSSLDLNENVVGVPGLGDAVQQ